ncbi:MAG: hypothetical protein GXO82_02315 [Chlorobi bacterium]|nr:hypothetical protein [Chlorobiota bacterium]
MTDNVPRAGNTGRVFIDAVEAFKNSGLNFRSLLVRIVDAAQPETLGELAFHGRYVWKLYRTLQSHALDDESMESLQSELARAVDHFRDLLRVPMDSWSNEQRDEMDNRFFQTSPECLRQLIMLAEDFFWVKNVELHFKDKLA